MARHDRPNGPAAGDATVSGYREFVPPAPLQPYVDRLWTQVSSGPVQPRAIPPDGCIDVIVNVWTGAAKLVGAMTHAATFASDTPVCLAAARFRPGGAVPLLRVAAVTLTDREVAAADAGLMALDQPPNPWTCVDPSWMNASVARLRDALLRLTRDAQTPHALVREASRILSGPRPAVGVGWERDLGVSRQHLARVFREHVGIPPKALARVARMQRALLLLSEHPCRPLAQLAADVGYYDQSHMALDFRALTGHPPSEARGSILPSSSLWALA